MVLVEFEPYGGKEKSLQDSVDTLTKTINSMIAILKGAEEELSKEPSEDHEISKKLEKLVEQNKDMAKAILLLLELNREHLPKIAAHTRESSRLMRKPVLSPRPAAPRPRPQPMQMPLPPEPSIPGREVFPKISEPPKQEEPKKKKGLFGFMKK